MARLTVTFILSLCISLYISTTQASIQNKPENEYDYPPNENHIFNTLHASMRQWGSSLHHNGMSFFLATVPQGTQFYHGTSSASAVNGTEWLAFEPEHAMVFARPFRGPGHGPGKGHGPKGGPKDKGKGPKPRSQAQIPFLSTGEQEEEVGYLHTYTVSKTLHLVYVDGMSAAKTANGTLDTQDRILFRDQLPTDGDGMGGERARAEMFCKKAREDWEGRVDGLLRMEAGFEIILCDFGRDLDLVRVARVKGRDEGDRDGGHPPGPPGEDGENTWFKAIAARYGGIGGNRVTVDLERFVTAYTYGLDLFAMGNMPRLGHLEGHVLEEIRGDVDEFIRGHEIAHNQNQVDWQAVADMVVLRYARELRYLASGQLKTVQELHGRIENTLGPFVDYGARDAGAEAERCAGQFVPEGNGTAARAVRSVARSICSTLGEAWAVDEYEAVVERIQTLMEYLSWTTWKECGGCADNEICVVPIWPLGTVEDYNHPQCREASRPNGKGQRYWGGGPGRGGPKKPPSWWQRLRSIIRG